MLIKNKYHNLAYPLLYQLNSPNLPYALILPSLHTPSSFTQLSEPNIFP